MPFFGASRQEPAPAPAPEPAPTRRTGLFHKHEPAPAPAPAPVSHTPSKRSSLFHRRGSSPSPPRSSVSTNTSSTSSVHRSNRGSILNRTFGHGNGDVDPSIHAARERVMGAEAAEADADKALAAARLRVREAKDVVRRLEAEAAEDARRAKIKQHQAREVSNRGRHLGRHG